MKGADLSPINMFEHKLQKYLGAALEGKLEIKKFHAFLEANLEQLKRPENTEKLERILNRIIPLFEGTETLERVKRIAGQFIFPPCKCSGDFSEESAVSENIMLGFEKTKVMISRDQLISKIPYFVHQKELRREVFSSALMDKTLFAVFTDYLADKEIIITQQNAMMLLNIAECYGIRELSIQCSKFIRDELKADSLVSILGIALQNNWQDLIWACLIFAQQPKNESSIDDIIRSSKIPDGMDTTRMDEIKNILKVALFLHNRNFDLYFSIPSARIICQAPTIKRKESKLEKILKPIIEEVHKEYLVKLNMLCGIEGFKLGFFADMSWDVIDFLSLSYLCVECTKVEVIPQKILDNLLFLNGVFCKKLQGIIEAPNAKTIMLGSSPLIQSILAPKALTINCFECRQLQTIYAPNAKIIVCGSCPNLKKITAKRGCVINSGNTSLQDLDMTWI